MSSRLKTTKKGSGTKGSGTKRKTPTPTTQAITVSALFKRQIEQQDSRDKASPGSKERESDDDVVFVKEEKESPYFSPKKSQDVSAVSADCREGTLVITESEQRGDRCVERRISRRLSLKKTRSGNESNSEALCVTSCLSVTARGDTSSLGVGGKMQVLEQNKKGHASSSQTSEVTSANRLTEESGEQSESRSLQGEAGTSVSTGIHDVDKKASPCDKIQTISSSKCKLSLKRKKKSEDDDTCGSSPPKKSPLNTGDGQLSTCSAAVSNTASQRTPTSTWNTRSQNIRSSAGLQASTTLGSDNRESLSTTNDGDPIATSTARAKTAAVSLGKLSSATSNLRTKKSSSSTRVLPKTPATWKRDESKDTPTADKEHTADKETEGLSAVETEGLSAVETEGLSAVDGKEEEKSEETTYRVPYYLENFNTIVKSVFEDDYNLKLFDDTDFKHLASFNNLSEAAQKVYVRLFSRKLAWLSMSKIKYPEIGEDLARPLGQLVTAGLVLSGDDVQDLAAVLGAMAAPDLRTLAKAYHISGSGQQKGQIITTLLAKSQQSTVASLFGQKIGAVREAMLKRAKKLLGPMYRLQDDPRRLYVRAMMLFSLINTNGDDDAGNGGQAQLFQMLMVNIGRVIYPAYIINRKTQIFRCREDLKRFEEALQLENELLACTGSGNWKGAYTMFLTVKQRYHDLILDSEITQWDASLSDFLRCYTAGSVLVRLMSQGIEILQRRKDYTAAVALIGQLLDQNIYKLDHHGYWWDRLALNLDVHLKQHEQALQAVQDGLADDRVRSGHRLSLYLRAEAICNKPKSLFSKRLKDFYHDPLVELPKAELEGRVLPHSLPGSRYQFITHTSYADHTGEEVTMCNVEQIVLDHYRDNGFPQGIHAEGATVSTLFCVYFWDVLFMDVADAFHSPYQTLPLDFHTDAFYERRQSSIDDRLAKLEHSSQQELDEMIGEVWEREKGVMCAGINWERFQSVHELQGLVRCMGGRVLAGILGRYARQPRHTRGGFPDLTLWNTHTNQLKISEVKGPGDRLSHKQMLWLDHLLKLGVDAEVCHVKPIGVKKLKPTPKV
ncbi:fanconi-associated nuclease 1-like isoform X3 [Littorina saxatilis]|uniref:fanconi-associated nuclease 1-like isoform X3 n=1 Tax=Littorina saxatilis TaxID=31220 RepID=UPI0038B5245A